MQNNGKQDKQIEAAAVSGNLYGAIPELLDSMPIGFAVMRVLLDEDNEPFDFIYKYVNPIYAYLLNKPLDDLLQYSWGQLFPNEDTKLLGAYANIALNGGSRIIEEIDPDNGKKLKTTCYQPAFGYCACIMEEIKIADAYAGVIREITEDETTEVEVIAQELAADEPAEMDTFGEEVEGQFDEAAMEDSEQETTEVENMEQVESVEQEEEQAAEIQPVETVAPVEEIQQVEEIKPIEAEIQPAEVAPVEEIQQTEVTTPVEEIQPIEEVQPIEAAEPIDEIKPIEELKPIEEAAPPVEEIQPLEEIPSMEEAALNGEEPKADNAMEMDTFGAVDNLNETKEMDTFGAVDNLNETKEMDTFGAVDDLNGTKEMDSAQLEAEIEKGLESFNRLSDTPASETGFQEFGEAVEEEIKEGETVTIFDIVGNAEKEHATMQTEPEQATESVQEPVEMMQFGEGAQNEPEMMQFGEGAQNEPEMMQFGEGAQNEPEMMQFGEETQNDAEPAPSIEPLQAAEPEQVQFGEPVQAQTEPLQSTESVAEEAPQGNAGSGANAVQDRIRTVIEDIDHFDEDSAMEELAKLVIEITDVNLATSVDKAKKMVECSMFAEARDLLETLV